MRRIDSADDIADALSELARCDARLARAIALAGPVPLRRKPPGFPALAEIILSQMVSKASANALWRKLELAAGEISPAAVLALSPDALRVAGLSGAKAATLQRVGAGVLAGDLDLDRLCDLDGQEAIQAMTAIKGVGPWTAEVYLLFCAGHPDIFPAGDVALQSAAAQVLGLDARPGAKALADLARPWSPWRGVAARLLWAYYAAVMRRDAAPLSP
ncbi:MAG: DNA-3-methyladenine glycosylase 2 family protein [Hoeflea sp.]|uniref:DNA-3-methyladenine glycosylase family protein n=1 Tax=Hoeflea sp. TaxID=1940281 RepID=UPI00272FEDF9|nr:DNA-3-methyladenine glycosylase 2 family protein [Hoeflea sp.]MDP2119610.1 DNA-3-methyladenine glycosylase 2 family protein [Hoeflea sp.]MDP3523325.1 DNA-3-methyladenine glycosylase 2 family protein [Hoeflea sp.]MDZ7600917.1 DNA-3-methyladenine glycosylase 2 family protein [Hoeflea sp.]